MNKLFFPLFVFSLIFVSCNNTSKKMNKAQYSGNDITGQVNIIRDKDSKAASLDININGKWELYAGNSVDNIDFSNPILEGANSGTFSIAVNDTARSYFEIVTPEGSAIISERHLPMQGGYNFRDLGGIKNTEGKYIKWGKVFRSDDLHNLTNADLRYLANIPLISIVDFRSDAEIKIAEDKVPTSVKEDYAFSIVPGDVLDFADFANLSIEQMDSVMMKLNISLVTDSSCIDQYRKYFDLLQNSNDVPLMFHCSAGKDRTGMGAALFLSALGVDEETIMKDYMASNVYLADKYSDQIAKQPNLKSLFEVKPQFIKAGLDQIKKDHGSVENYLTNVLRVDLAKMKEMYLY